MKSIQDYLDYKPYFLKYDLKKYGLIPKVTYYETSFFCNKNKIIHQNLKDVFNCVHCITPDMISEYGENNFKKLKL